MSRTIIDLPATLLHQADEVCQLLGISRAEIVRRALREFLQHTESLKTDGFGLWARGATVAGADERATSPGRSSTASRRGARKG